MDIAWIIREIDTEIERLRHMRDFITSFSSSLETPSRAPRKAAPSPKTSSNKTSTKKSRSPQAEPPLIVVPPKEKRTYTPRRKSPTEAPRALASAIPDHPVFVSKPSSVSVPSVKVEAPQIDTKELEAAVRRSLFGQTA